MPVAVENQKVRVVLAEKYQEPRKHTNNSSRPPLPPPSSRPSPPGQLMTIGCGLTVSSPQILSVPLLAFLKKGGIVQAVSPWYCVAWKTLFSVRSSFQEKDLCCLSLSSLNCRVSSFCMLDSRGLGPSFVRVCFKRCHCAPSILKGPDGR